MEVVALDLIEIGVEGERGHADDVRHGGAQFVADVRDERTFGVVGDL